MSDLRSWAVAEVPENGRQAHSSMDVEYVTRSRALNADSSLDEKVRNVASWTFVPPLEPNERSAWVPHGTGCLKIKGVGLGTVTGPIQPSTEPYTAGSQHPHVGVGDDLHLCDKYTPPSPYGGIFLDRARLEYNNAQQLVDAGCPSTFPVAVLTYTGHRCEWASQAQLGVVVSAIADPEPSRWAALFAADPNEATGYGRAAHRMIRSWGPTPSEAARRSVVEAGRTLRAFSESGLYRHPSYPTNFLFDESTARLSLLDLDSSRPLADCYAPRRALEILRDVAGAVFNLGRMLLDPYVAARVEGGSETMVDLFQRYIEAYFWDVESPGTVADFRDAFSEAAQDLAADSTATDHRVLDRRWSYSTVMCGLANTYRHSSLHERYPLGPSERDLRERASEYLGR